MTQILFIGQTVETVDFSDPALPPGLTVEKIQAGIAIAMASMADRGWQADLFLVPPDKTAGPLLDKQLARKSYNCVVIGAGIRLPPKSLPLFEVVINAVHKGAPNAVIAFNTGPETTADCAARWLKQD
ncbi:hypothetical protein JFU37_02495 [Pseudomonas sp. TH41]|uniref:hypothetical protein n=1 Tax=Pseudomonas sp. TH41 TaxID=2796405 RepID=UPI0019128663|nr:hypothetical protein [Pseudomonas sp. TH41]MBK5351398.1 hypothetical protein [Pseudomonas sp. TH41]